MDIDLKTSQRWAEYWALFLLVLGFLFSIQTKNVVVLYGIAFLFGAIFGRFFWKYRKNLKGSALTIILGFLVGFLLGAQAGERKVLILLFVLGIAVSWYVHDKNILRSAEY